MLRAGASHPDADEQMASTSTRSSDQSPDWSSVYMAEKQTTSADQLSDWSTGYMEEQTASADQSVDWSRMYMMLNEYLHLENKFQPKLCLPEHSEKGEVTTGTRDGAVHVLRCLKVWFDLPADVLVYAVSLFDRFLTKMKVRTCHVPCITVSCMNIAIEEHSKTTKQPRTVTIEELIKISQCNCTLSDVQRMAAVVSDKLSVAGGDVTCAHWCRLLHAMMAPCLVHKPAVDTLNACLNLLEIVMCHASCVNARMSELALVIVYQKLEQELVSWSQAAGSIPDDAYCLYEFAAQLQAHCNMSDASLVATRSLVSAVEEKYDAREGSTHRQALVWKLSERTLRLLRPLERVTSLLPTIEEQHSRRTETEEDLSWPMYVRRA